MFDWTAEITGTGDRSEFKLETVLESTYRHTYSAKFTITIRLELYAQLQLFSFSN